MAESIGIGMAGLGTVGGGVYACLARNRALLAQRLGFDLALRRIAVRDVAKARAVAPPRELLADDWREVVADPSVRIVIELMGGTAEPLEMIRAALRAGKPVVTGNKALLAEHGQELFHLAREQTTPIFYEAAVAGGIPIIKAVREAFVGNRFESIHGILNGTSNYILTRMEETGMGFAEALAEAQAEGYAEADPALDINGWDAAHKALILAALAYGKWLDPKGIFVEGVERVTAADIRFAAELGYRIKLLATIRSNPDCNSQAIEVRVCPTLIPSSHVIASVGGVFNAVWLRGDVVGEALFYGRGAGSEPTASSVIADLAEAAAALTAPRLCMGFTPHDLYGDCVPEDETVSRYYLRLGVEDRPGVLARIAGALGAADIGIVSVIQPELHEPGCVPLVLMIHDAPLGRMRRALAEIAALDCVKEEPVLLHVEAFQ